MRDEGEPIRQRQSDRRAAEAEALRESVLAVVLGGAAILITVILALMLLAMLEAVGLWDPEIAPSIVRG